MNSAVYPERDGMKLLLDFEALMFGRPCHCAFCGAPLAFSWGVVITHALSCESFPADQRKKWEATAHHFGVSRC